MNYKFCLKLLFFTAIANRLKKIPSEYFKDLYFDAIAYSPQALNSLIGFVGTDRLVFGTDNPFFPPPNESNVVEAQWISTNKVYKTIDSLNNEETKQKILYKNASKLFHL